LPLPRKFLNVLMAGNGLGLFLHKQAALSARPCLKGRP
jgi:hypothetical protein